MTDIPSIGMWKGKRIDDECSRDELLDCIEFLAKRDAEFSSLSTAVALGKVEMLKRIRQGS